MKSRPGPSSVWHRGVTLVETLIGALLLGTLLVSIVLARGRMDTQARRADDRLQAVAVLEGVVEAWWSAREFPPDGTGQVAVEGTWYWRKTTIHSGEAEQLRAELVAVDIFSSDAPGALPAARLELLVPVKEKPKTKNQQEQPDEAAATRP